MRFVLGHKIPDTDAICSALVYAQFLNDQGIFAQAIALWSLNNETLFVLDEHNISHPPIVDALHQGSEIVLVDHNESSQSIWEREQYRLVEVIDHHKLNLTTSEPINIVIKPLASTCSVLRLIFEQANYTPSASMAKLMISGILSDTLHFRSPTTTHEDKIILEKLNTIAQFENIEYYARSMFEAKSNLGDIDIESLVQLDYKQFEFWIKRIGYGVIETTNPWYALSRKEEILKELYRLKKHESLDAIFLSIIDILQEKNLTIVLWEVEEKIIKEAFAIWWIDNNIVDLWSLISRKKQLIPPLDLLLTKLS